MMLLLVIHQHLIKMKCSDINLLYFAVHLPVEAQRPFTSMGLHRTAFFFFSVLSSIVDFCKLPLFKSPAAATAGNPELSREHNLNLLSKSLRGASKIIPPRCPSPSTLTNHIGVSDIGRPKALLFYRPDTAYVLISSACLDMSPCILLIGCSVIQ